MSNKERTLWYALLLSIVKKIFPQRIHCSLWDFNYYIFVGSLNGYSEPIFDIEIA